jgi:DNA-binding PadR family transcriptional regulator
LLIDIEYLYQVSMRLPFLALLAESPRHGYELKQAFDQRFGAALPPLNGGQVYTTLQRLERDGLVNGSGVPDDGRQKRVYELTPAGREALAEWVSAPSSATRLRDEFFLKLVLAGLSGIADPAVLIERQRRECLESLRAMSRVAENGDAVSSLLAEGAALHLEADLRWLELCERRLLQEETDGNGASG